MKSVNPPDVQESILLDPAYSTRALVALFHFTRNARIASRKTYYSFIQMKRQPILVIKVKQSPWKFTFNGLDFVDVLMSLVFDLFLQLRWWYLSDKQKILNSLYVYPRSAKISKTRATGYSLKITSWKRQNVFLKNKFQIVIISRDLCLFYFIGVRLWVYQIVITIPISALWPSINSLAQSFIT